MGASEDAMDITRIDHYADNRFSRTVLNQHGAYLVDREPYEIEITGADSALVRGKDPSVFQTLIEEFRFHAPHIVKFCDEGANLLTAYPLPKLLELSLDSIQPSQFFIDQEKLNAVRTFLEKAEDIVIQVIPYGNRYISLDGHTRLFFAVQNGFSTVKAVESETDDWVWPFVREAERRKILCPRDMILLPHEAYEIQWNQYCDAVFANKD